MTVDDSPDLVFPVNTWDVREPRVAQSRKASLVCSRNNEQKFLIIISTLNKDLKSTSNAVVVFSLRTFRHTNKTLMQLPLHSIRHTKDLNNFLAYMSKLTNNYGSGLIIVVSERINKGQDRPARA